MTTTQFSISTFGLRDYRAWVAAAAFTIGNILLPQLCHLMPQGGLVFLPIYFFTLIAALGCGWRVGLLVALASPLANNLLFGMPPVAMLPIILAKGMLLVSAVTLAKRLLGLSLLAVVAAVVAYQAAGCAIEWAVAGGYAALQDLRLGWPGLLLQAAGGWAFVRMLRKG